MDIQKEREAFEAEFKLNVIYKRESIIRKNNILEFAETAGMYFNIVTNNAWQLWQAAKAQAVPEGFVLVPQKSLKVALFWMDEDIDPWHMGNDGFADLFKHKPILEKAMIEAQEQSHD